MIKHTQTIRRQIADELCECIWPFCEIGAKKDKDKSLFLLPTEENLRKAWLGAISRNDKLRKKVFICSDYFEEKSFDVSGNSIMSCFIRTDL